jgi:two-component system CheB/CheR fusion protein
VFFLLDWLLPPGLTVELLQVAIVLFTLFADGRRPTLVFGGITTLFVVAGYGVHLYQGEPVTSLANHGIVLLGLWMAVGVVLAYKHVLRTRRESEAQARTILNTTVDGIITLNADGTIESVNPAAESMFDADARALAGAALTTLLAPDHRKEIADALETYRETGESPLKVLSDRELEVFELTGKGSSTREIAEGLHLSVKTVESHRARIKDKLNLDSCNELMKHAVQ